MINLFRTLEEALYVRTCPTDTQFIHTGIQLLPNNKAKYVQKTNVSGGINLEDWTVFVVNSCGEKQDVTDRFLVEKLTNANDGTPQLIWSLLNVPYDFGWQFVYLEIRQSVGETFYSNPFMLTDFEKEKVVQINYKKEKTDDFLSIGARLWYHDIDKKTDLKTYYELSTKTTVSYSVKSTIIEIYKTDLISKIILIGLSDIFESPYLYINGLRYSLFEAINFPAKISEENFSMIEIKVSRADNVTFSDVTDYNGIDYGIIDYNV